jgi:hypothetical protein
MYQTFKELPRFEEEPVVISLNQNFFMDHGLYISKYGYLIFLRIVIMNLKNRHDTQQGFVRFIIPTQQWSTSLVSHRYSQDSIQMSSVYSPPKGGGHGNLQDSPTTKVEIIRNGLQNMVASTLLIIYKVDSHISTLHCQLYPQL